MLIKLVLYVHATEAAIANSQPMKRRGLGKVRDFMKHPHKIWTLRQSRQGLDESTLVRGLAGHHSRSCGELHKPPSSRFRKTSASVQTMVR